MRKAILYVSVLLSGCDDLCGNELKASVKSPNGSRAAYVFERSCGATTGFSTQVSVMPIDEPLGNEPGNIAVFDDGADVLVTWGNAETIILNVPSGEKPRLIDGQERTVKVLVKTEL